MHLCYPDLTESFYFELHHSCNEYITLITNKYICIYLYTHTFYITISNICYKSNCNTVQLEDTVFTDEECILLFMCSLYTVHEITCFSVTVQAVKNGVSLQQIGTMLYNLAAKIKVQISHFIPLIVEYIVANRTDSQQQINGKYQICFYFQCKYFFLSCATICSISHGLGCRLFWLLRETL